MRFVELLIRCKSMTGANNKGDFFELAPHGTIKRFAQGCECELCAVHGWWWQEAWRRAEMMDLVEMGVTPPCRQSGCVRGSCDSCKARYKENRARKRKENYEKMMRGEVEPVHGERQTYRTFLCRCEECKEASLRYDRERKRPRKTSSESSEDF